MNDIDQNKHTDVDTLSKVTEIFKALSDLNRLRIMELLEFGGSKCRTHFTYIEYVSIKCVTSTKVIEKYTLG